MVGVVRFVAVYFLHYNLMKKRLLCGFECTGLIVFESAFFTKRIIYFMVILNVTLVMLTDLDKTLQYFLRKI